MMKRIFTIKVTKWVFTGYILALLIVSIFQMSLSKGGFLVQEQKLERSDATSVRVIEQSNGSLVSTKEETSVSESEDLISMAIAGRLDDAVKAKKIGNWVFELKGQTIDMDTLFNDSNVQLIAEHKKDADTKIDIDCYLNRCILDGVELTNKIQAPKIEMTGNILILTKAPIQELLVVKVNKDFFLQQFGKKSNTSMNGFEHRFEHNFFGGECLLYLKIPQKVQINNGNDRIMWLGE